MTIIVTGGAGFIGSNFIFHMLNKYPDYRIICLDCLTYAGNLSTLEPVMDNPNFRFVKESITDRDAVYKLFEEEHPDMVVNFAAESHVDRSIENPEVFLDTNIKGTAVLMDACRKYGIKRYHQVSTDEVYGDLPLDRPDLFFTEETPIHTSSPYSSSKAGADLLVLAYHRTYGLPVTISRCSNNYGPYHFPEKLIPLMIANALADKPLRLTRRQWIPLAAFLIIALHSFTSPYWPEMPVLSALKEMDTVLFTSVALAVLALIRVDGEQIFCPVEAFTKGVSWPIVMAVASMAAIGGLLVADEYGIKAWLTQALGGLFSNHSPLLFVAMTVLITLLLTNFFSNTATLLVVSSLVSALSGPLVDAGYDITILAVAISLSSMVAYLTYASSGQAAILLSQKNMDNKFIWTYGIAAMLLYAAVVILVSAVCLFF